MLVVVLYQKAVALGLEPLVIYSKWSYEDP